MFVCRVPSVLVRNALAVLVQVEVVGLAVVDVLVHVGGGHEPSEAAVADEFVGALRGADVAERLMFAEGDDEGVGGVGG